MTMQEIGTVRDSGYSLLAGLTAILLCLFQALCWPKEVIPYRRIGKRYKFKIYEVDEWVDSGKSADIK
ncbi:transcriptional regulator [Youngiibacter fragilis 232.1]|uniref:Transcriptional regulator n=1 Tax=Youngiibacter fragilis 232.1 TaxID=994573 RepID=V7I3I1_9CLOT|nr:transcriptional regulator [Youngiibacter fragilis 232.1]